ncbi:uncharacterized protein LOC143218315 [Lasioglossum baleicum]|uniref:uncharacterized protein LOC143218315 n=1 Tax=Lasioglossum baleicum TaxID=434251 RepID=UPI003FCC44FC
MPISLRILCLVTLVLCNIHGSLEHEIPRRSFLSRRAIDGTRGRKYFDPEEEGVFDSYGSAGGQYDPYEEKTDFSDIRRNVPGEPGADYPAYTTLPQTGFTCEGRSRGYYADEVAGCQVFHVCHDVLVSSFLCPIGSLFSQKLLTCDWWTKVDCSTSGKYIDVNRNSYQQDDDEMIRNAYAMISLQSGTDVTKDGLVDPDRTGSIVDYQRIAGRLFDLPPADASGNDLRNTFEDYPRPIVRNFLPPYQTKSRKPETSLNYQGRFYAPEKSRSPYEDSPIIRVQKIKDHGDQQPRSFQDSYRRPNEFTNRFQPSYAPTVPTVTTTTRRFYSPTVPTTFRPSTVAYNKLDQAIDSSEYYFSHSGTKSLVTPPTIFPEDSGRIAEAGKTKVYVDPARKADQDDYNRRHSYEDDYGDEDFGDDGAGKSRERFQVRVADDLQFNQTNVHEQSPLYSEDYRGFDEGGIEDIETRGSIGLGHALRQPFRGISVQQQNPVEDKIKFGRTDKEESKAGYQHTLVRPESTDAEEEEHTTEQYQRDDLTSSDSLQPSTTPSFVESTIKASAAPFNATPGEPEKEQDVTDRGNRAGEFVGSPENRSKFQIKVPDLSEMSSLLIRYTTDDAAPSSGSRTTELPRLQNTFSDDYVVQPTTRDGEKFTGSRVQARPLASQWYSSPSSEHLKSKNSPFRSSPFPRNSTREKTVDNPERIELPIDDRKSSSPIGFGNKSDTESRRPYSSGPALIDVRDEAVTQRFNERTPPVTKSSSDGFSTLTPRSGTEDERRAIESSTANAILGSIPPETLKQIEETIDQNNSPYQVTLTVNKDEDLVPHDELIGKLVAQQAKETLDDRDHQLEVVKFVESETPTTTVPEETTVSNLDLDYYQNTEDNFTGEFMDSLKNYSTVSLLQLMSELLRLDRAPRPFSLGNDRSRTQSWGAQMIAKDVNSSVQTEVKNFSKLEATPTTERSAPFKEKILDKLSENFGEPLYKTDRYFELPQPERALDFQTGQPIKTLKKDEEPSLTESFDATDESSPDVSTETSTAITTPKTTLTTESTKTVVQTEFLPSIGFSFDTDEGREEYVEAVLGGLIEPQPAESEKKEAVVGLAGETIAPKNGTTDGDTEKIQRKGDSSEEGVSTLKKV